MKNSLQSIILGFHIPGESRHSREQEFNGYFREQFGIKHKLPALFIDAYPDVEDEAEIIANINEVVELRRIIEKLPLFPLEDAEVIFFAENNDLKPVPVSKPRCIILTLHLHWLCLLNVFISDVLFPYR